jgi:hypothetical protein
MKYLLVLFITLPAFASHFADNIKSMDTKGDEVTLTFNSHSQVFRMPANSASIPCLEDGFKAMKPVDVVINDENGNITGCKLAPKELPGKIGH